MTAAADSPEASRTADCVVVMLGSNIEPERNLPLAVGELGALGRVVAVSSVWQTAAIGDTNQADFCNAAVLLRTELEPAAIIARLNDIEARLGRVRDPRNKNAARTIDLDLAVIPGPARSVGGKEFPDPEIVERVFLAAPLEEIWPEVVLPDGRLIGQVAAFLRERDGARLRLRRRGDVVLLPDADRRA
jgi:2-amino-4-hydroxy-6-hydroxymethyldihydropteridine diphosphokinase